MFLPAVLPKVVMGDMTAKQVGDEMATLKAEFNELSGLLADDPKAGLKGVERFEAKHPELADFQPWVRVRLSYLPKYGEAGEAAKYADAVVAKAIKREDATLLGITAAILRLGDGKESKELLAIAVKAAEAEVRLDGGKNARSLIALAETYFVSGDAAKAKEFARKALDAATGDPAAIREAITKDAAKYGVNE